VLIVGASQRYIGAAYLAAAAAVRVGAGLVTLAVPPATQRALAGRSVETTFLPLEDDAASPGVLAPQHVDAVATVAGEYDAVALGPGIGTQEPTRRFVLDLLARLAGSATPLVIDADGLNILAIAGDWPRPAEPHWVLTPHPGEMGRLCGLSAQAVQQNRLRVASDGASRWGQVVVLKGAPSIVAAPEGRACLSPFANAALATAGSGDVLTGTIAGLLAQGCLPFDAAALGTFVHGLAGEWWRVRHGSAGLAVSDLVAELPTSLRYLRQLA
jgi:hydroxyethylthiazole kinase-like uncharacterized protein yjeF